MKGFDVLHWRDAMNKVVASEPKELQRNAELPPSWVRLSAGTLGFFSSLMALGIPGIILLIVDRTLASGSQENLASLALLGIGTAISVCLIDLLRMKALEAYFVNVRAMVLYQDACFAVFWMILLAFVHPAIPLISAIVIGSLFFAWRLRKPHRARKSSRGDLDEMDPVAVAATGLGPAYLQQTAEGKLKERAQPDFQTVGQATWLNLIQMAATIGLIGLVAYLQIQGSITLGTMIAIVFIGQYSTSVFVRFFQVQALKPVDRDLSFISSLKVGETHKKSPPPKSDQMEMLSIENVEDFGFAPFSADIFQGLCLALIGPNASGKSEILNALATGDFYEGKISYKGQNWGRDHGSLNSVGFASIPPIYLNGSIVENITCFNPQAKGAEAVEIIRALDPFEDVFTDSDFVNDQIDPRNLAQAQLVSLARCFYRDCEIIVLDRPETYLDKAARAGLMSLILKAKTESKIVILATDDDYLMTVADEVVKLERGEVTDRGPMDEVLKRYHQRWVRVSFRPTKRDAFRLMLWLDAQFPVGMQPDLKVRVKQATQDMLFFAPRDQTVGDDEVLFDVRMTPREVYITMHDRGDVISADRLGDEEQEFSRILDQTDGFEQSLRNGYRQLFATFNEERTETELTGVVNG